MRRKFIIFLFAVTTFLTASGGLASILAAAAPNTANVESTLQLRQNHVETAPIIIAGLGGKRPNGNSWGG